MSCLLAAAAVLTLAGAASGLEPWPQAPVYEGADVSVYQGGVDFSALKAGGTQVVYIRSGFGLTEDRRFAANAAAAAEAGIHHGFYFYVTARNAADARAQARYFASLIAGKAYDCRPAMDFESFRGLSAQLVREIGLAFLETLEAETGHRPLLYTDTSSARTVWNKPAFARYGLWAAAYGAAQPEIPGSVWAGWAGFQYTSSGRLPGISGRVDRDRFTAAVLLSESGEGPSPAPVAYTVRSGDTLWGIARRYGVTVQALASANHIQNPALIYPGRILRITGGETGPSSAPVTYTVRPGDTLWGIARRYGVTVQALASANHIQNPALIYPGQVLRV